MTQAPRTEENPQEDWKDWQHSDNYDAIEEVVDALRGIIPSLDERFIELETFLKKLNDDLTEEYIRRRGA
jgi:hypothetical protein